MDKSPYGERHHLVECQCAECYPAAVEPINCLPPVWSDVLPMIAEVQHGE